MKTETNNALVAVVEFQNVIATPVTKEDVQKGLYRLFKALESATQNSSIALDIVNKIADGIENDPEFSRKILTPDNIAKVYALKAKADTGKLRVQDVEKAFPELINMIPGWSMLKSLIPKNVQ